MRQLPENAIPPAAIVAETTALAPPTDPASQAPRWGWLELFVAIQFASTGLLFLPGAQRFRFIIRALPYLSALAMWVLALRAAKQMETETKAAARLAASDPSAPSEAAASPKTRRRALATVAHPSAKWLVAVLLLLVLQLFHPNTHSIAGPVQVLFQLTIVSPLFWGRHMVRSADHLRRTIWLMFICNLLSVTFGALQVYYPERFMPAEFTTVDPEMVERLTFTGAGGRQMLRPPGLTDIPGGASLSASLTAALGVLLAISPRAAPWIRVCCLGGTAMAFFVLFITQVRSLFLTTTFMVAVACVALWRHGRRKEVIAVITAGILLLVAAFGRAVMVGGDTVRNRFMGIQEKGIAESYQQNRGIFLTYTVTYLLPRTPLGAGLGRWGMMQTYFNHEPPEAASGPLYVEIQITGWLFDGGVPLWILYGGAFYAALLYGYRVSVRSSDPSFTVCGSIVLGFTASAALQSLGAPIFNTQVGLQIWFLNAALFGAAQASQAHHPGQPATKPSAIDRPLPEWKAKLYRRYPPRRR